ncbi:alcohol dehydrogenase [Alsobacter metallidurans]|uniref:Alcohol dehydrogenase n=1 Tax=Alsobacter metallidurans TaxID=340221 RepID=A0A917IB12_9HYPH|nr:SDR family oxidoreductase [Alsobacter metallidurans]GGH27866.1 alcohol dehydrogenase [Alsobacter metallidurans]
MTRAGRLDGRIALITGGASGLGAATARAFVREGARVMIADIDEGRAAELARELGDGAAFVPCDHTDRGQTEAAVAATLAAFGALDILHNNAGGPFAGPVESADDAVLARVIGVNLVGVFKMTQSALPALRESAARRPHGASILFTSSLQGIKARPNYTVYTASKHGVVGLVKGLALELAPANIRVNAICPTVTETPMLRSFLPGMAPDMDEARARLKATIPLGRMPEPEDTANAALFLASDEARMITGVALAVDGGQMAG